VLFLAGIAATSAAAEPVRIALPATSVDFAPPYVAEKIGLFKKANLDVKITVFRGGAASSIRRHGIFRLLVPTSSLASLSRQRGLSRKF
jgi:hypothetical protein